MLSSWVRRGGGRDELDAPVMRGASHVPDRPVGTVGGVFHHDARLGETVTRGVRAGEILGGTSLLTFVEQALHQAVERLTRGRLGAAGVRPARGERVETEH